MKKNASHNEYSEFAHIISTEDTVGYYWAGMAEKRLVEGKVDIRPVVAVDKGNIHPAAVGDTADTPQEGDTADNKPAWDNPPAVDTVEIHLHPVADMVDNHRPHQDNYWVDMGARNYSRNY